MVALGFDLDQQGLSNRVACCYICLHEGTRYIALNSEKIVRFKERNQYAKNLKE